MSIESMDLRWQGAIKTGTEVRWPERTKGMITGVVVAFLPERERLTDFLPPDTPKNKIHAKDRERDIHRYLIAVHTPDGIHYYAPRAVDVHIHNPGAPCYTVDEIRRGMQ